MAEQRLAHCLVCGVCARNSEDFLCTDCADPNKIIMTCTCGARHEILAHDPLLAKLAAQTDPSLITSGLAIKTPHCGRCRPASNDMLMNFQLFRVRPSRPD